MVYLKEMASSWAVPPNESRKQSLMIVAEIKSVASTDSTSSSTMSESTRLAPCLPCFLTSVFYESVATMSETGNCDPPVPSTYSSVWRALGSSSMGPNSPYAHPTNWSSSSGRASTRILHPMSSAES